MRVSLRDNGFACRNCEREFPVTELDKRMWCAECRARVIRRSSFVARVVAFIGALGLSIWIYYLVGPAPRFLVVYLVMVVAAYIFLYKLTQRVAFEVIRARGVPPPPPETDG